MGRHYTEQEQLDWVKQSAKKVISAKVIIFDPSVRVLVLKPSYKPGWHFPGGVVDEAESPLQAAIREVKEEVNLDVSPNSLHFVGVRYGISKARGDDYLHIVFSCQLSDEQAKHVQLVDAENEAMKWVDLYDDTADIQDKVVALVRNKHDKNHSAVYTDTEEIVIPV
jgi:8-oxo-dGTP pyrophosphatase MutT (NUDIX family)